jgi:hypothetical protein
MGGGAAHKDYLYIVVSNLDNGSEQRLHVRGLWNFCIQYTAMKAMLEF